MKYFMAIACVLALLGATLQVAHAQQTTFRVGECSGCTAAQMQTAAAATQLSGVIFIYDLAANVIRKYNVDRDSTCGAPTMPQGSSTNDQQAKSAAGIQCGSFRYATELTPVDSDVQATFDALRSASVANPGLVAMGKAQYRGDLPENPADHLPFDLQAIAWDYPQGDFLRFHDTLEHILGSRSRANNFIPGLGDYLYGWSVASFSVNVGLPAGVIGSLVWDRSMNSARLEICNANGDCWRGTVSMNRGGIATLTYEGTFDTNLQMYPSESGQAPGQLTRWKFDHVTESEHFADALRHVSVPIPYNRCGGISYLNTVRRNGKIIFQSWECGAVTP